jgi:hypothetical protein
MRGRKLIEKEMGWVSRGRLLSKKLKLKKKTQTRVLPGNYEGCVIHEEGAIEAPSC